MSRKKKMKSSQENNQQNQPNISNPDSFDENPDAIPHLESYKVSPIDLGSSHFPGSKNISPFEMIKVQGNSEIPSFEIGKFVVVQKNYEELIGENPSVYKKGDESRLPVENISLEEAVKYCNKLSESQSLKPYYDDEGTPISGSNGYRLPSVEEWLFAANGGSKKSPFKFSGSDSINEVAWYQGNNNGHVEPHEVGDDSKNPNQLGIFDMSGNVWEWCQSEGNKRICCGGAFDSSEDFLNLDSEKCIQKHAAFTKKGNISFRLARTIIGE